MIGTVYKLTSPHTDKIYVGSTLNCLRKRLYQHKRKTNKCSSKQIVDCGQVCIEPLVVVEVENRHQLREIEKQHINDKCVNINVPNRDTKQYYSDNKERLRKYFRERYTPLKEGGESYPQLKRYHEKRDDILRAVCLRNAHRLGRPPTKTSMQKHNISWEDLARYAIEA